MTEKEQIARFVAALGFARKSENAYSKTYANGYEIAVDAAGTIDYGGKIGREGEYTGNFSQDESYVVLECVDRLLTKGYAPEDLTLEKKYPMGRGASGGRADIVVRGRDGKTLLIIECKTWGGEYDRETAKMENNGGQLFSYLQQDKSTEYLCLYTSRPLESGAPEYRNAVISFCRQKTCYNADNNLQ